MTRVIFAGILLLGIVQLFLVNAAPQFGGSFSQANAQAGSFGGAGYNRPGFGPSYPGAYGPPRHPLGFGGQGFNRRNNGGLSISVSKSISIGGGGSAQSSSSARGK